MLAGWIDFLAVFLYNFLFLKVDRKSDTLVKMGLGQRLIQSMDGIARGDQKKVVSKEGSSAQRISAPRIACHGLVHNGFVHNGLVCQGTGNCPAIEMSFHNMKDICARSLRGEGDPQF